MDLMTTREAAELLHVPVNTLRYWRHVGDGPRSFSLSGRKGGRVMYRRQDIEAYIQNRLAEAASAATG